VTGEVDRRRLMLIVGQRSLTDHFDDNACSHNAGEQFFNWTLVTHGACDIAADAYSRCVQPMRAADACSRCALALVLAAKVGGAARAAGTDPYRETRRRMAVSSPDLRLRPDRHGLPPCPLRTIPFMITPMITPMCLRSPGSAASHGPAHSMHRPSSAQSATCCGLAG
jgi:hypothetical protein